MRFYKDRLYHFRGVRYGYVGGGGARASQPYEQVVLGLFVGTRAVKADCIGEFRPDGRTYEVDDGHLPGYRPRVSGDQLAAALLAGPYPSAYPVGEG